ncbi:MAG: hypothetical protein M3O61_04880 [Gemmatimonadota bacterium]|nr:hypothetical protein [Gemmatimonadota bacterium]
MEAGLSNPATDEGGISWVLPYRVLARTHGGISALFHARYDDLVCCVDSGVAATLRVARPTTPERDSETPGRKQHRR